MITKKENPQSRRFKGVAFDVLAVGNKSMVTRMKYETGNKVPFHAHPNEQSEYVITGKYRIKFQNTDEIQNPGDSYSIPEKMEHALEVIKLVR